MDITQSTTTRRRILSTGFLALASAFLPGLMPLQDVMADKKKKKKKKASVSERTDTQREVCELLGGGKLAVMDGPDGGNTTECKGGLYNGDYCFNSKKASKCTQALTQDPSSPLNDSTAPPSEGNEQPYDGGKPVGGGGAVDPIGGVEDPSGPVTGPIILLSERQASVEARRYGKRHKKGHGKARKR